MGADVTTADLRSQGDLYPVEALRGLTTALVGFCAAFLGRQDCAWIEGAGLEAVCVDLDAERLLEMALIYPDRWAFVCDDFFDYAARRYAEGREYDLVSLDPPTNLFERCADAVGLWCSLSRRLVVLGTGRHTTLGVPKGWQVTSVWFRSAFRGGTYWTTLERA